MAATMIRLTASLALVVSLAACGPAPDGPTTIAPRTDPVPVAEPPPAPAPEDPPLGRLPRDIRPEHYTLALQIVPSSERFSGSARIRVTMDRPRDVIWMHGRRLSVTDATVTVGDDEPVTGTWEMVDEEEGVAALRLPRPVGPGQAQIAITYTAPFDRTLKGLYRVDEAGQSYAFTQFEATSARQAFPGFDEPSFKVPFDITLIGRRDHVVAGNTPVAEETEIDGGLKRVRFATTRPMPTYLVAWAVGPLDVVEGEAIAPNAHRSRPLPFRALAVRGKGARLAYALEHTPALLADLEAYFGSEYPYAKLDIVAVPDFGAGAMENVGLVTFREQLLLLDDEAPERQKRGFAYVMAHELAHMWFGNLVTMPWWDDLWLNEAFATWMGNKVVRNVFPDYQAEVGMLDWVQGGAMRTDSMVSARQIRQPIETSHDIRNAFDPITYSKGGGVLEMFERWLTFETFRDGLRRYMRRHAWGTATGDDLLAALSQASGRDVATPFNTFLQQPGIPFLAIEPACEEGRASMSVSQSRYLPVGSAGDRDRTWKLPVCVRWSAGGEERDTCALVQSREATIPLPGEGCPDWVMPNADGAGYFRFSLPTDALGRLRADGWAHLTPREKLAVADSLRAGIYNGQILIGDVLDGIEPIARDPVRPVASVPMELVGLARSRLVEPEQRVRVERFGARLYSRDMRALGWSPRAGEDSETNLRRGEVVEFMALTARDRAVRRDAVRRGRAYVGYGGDGAIHADAVDSNLVSVALAVAVQDGDAAFFDHVEQLLFASDDAVVRGNLLAALGSTHDPELSRRALALSLDERLRVNEMGTTLQVQTRDEVTREAAWAWVMENFDAIVERGSRDRAGWSPWLAAGFCSEEEAAAVQAFFAPRIEDLPGGPRNLAGALESIRLCAARAGAQRDSARAFFRR